MNFSADGLGVQSAASPADDHENAALSASSSAALAAVLLALASAAGFVIATVRALLRCCFRGAAEKGAIDPQLDVEVQPESYSVDRSSSQRSTQLLGLLPNMCDACARWKQLLSCCCRDGLKGSASFSALKPDARGCAPAEQDGTAMREECARRGAMPFSPCASPSRRGPPRRGTRRSSCEGCRGCRVWAMCSGWTDVAAQAQLGGLLAVTMSESLVSSVIFPFAPFMVRDLGIRADEVGFYAGLLSSAYNIAQLPAGIFWGRQSDVYGWRRVLLIGLVCTSCATILFGFSATYPQALFARLLAGLLNGNSAVARAAVRQITTEANRARAFSLMGLAYGVGFFMGSSLGGILARPADVLPALLQHTLLDKYPYVLPCFTSTVGSLLALVLLGGPETSPALLRRDGGRGASGELAAESSLNGASLHGQFAPPELWSAIGTPHSKSTAAPPPPQSTRDRSARPAKNQRSCDTAHLLRTPQDTNRLRGVEDAEGTAGSSTARGLVVCICAQFCLNIVIIGLEEGFSLFCASERFGLAMQPSDLSASLLPIGVALLVWPFTYPVLEDSMGSSWVFRSGVCLFLLTTLGIPALRPLRAWKQVLWSGLFAVAFARGVAGVSSTTAISMILNGKILGNFGLVNGVAASAASLARSIAPALLGTVFAYCTAEHMRFPLDYHAPFYLIALVCVVTLLSSACF